MNISKKQLSTLFIILYLIGMIVSAFTLFNIKDGLMYDLHVLTISEANLANSLFYQTYIIIGASMILGLLAIYFLFKGVGADVIYVEKTKEEERQEIEKADAEARKEDKINRNALQDFFANKDIKNPKDLEMLLSWVCKNIEASQGAIYQKELRNNVRAVKLIASYAMNIAESEEIVFEYGEGLVGQVAKEQKTLYLDEVPEGFVKIISGLGSSSPSYLLIIPIISESDLMGVVEIASFVKFRKNDITTLEQFFNSAKEGKADSLVEKESVVVEDKAEKPKKNRKEKEI